MTPAVLGSKIRVAAAAGSFYPSDPAELADLMDRLLRQSEAAVDGEIVAALAPHAGYIYSGPVAAWTYAALRGRAIARVVVMAPTHTVPFRFSSVYCGDAYETPLGAIPVDKEFAQKLAAMDDSIELSELGHAVTAHGGEHAIEVQLPWLQRALGEFQLAPVIMGEPGYESSRALGAALARLVASESNPAATLVLASSDLSHYHSDKTARRIDSSTLHALSRFDYLSMARNFEAHVWEACGDAAIVAAMIYAERMGAHHAQVLRYGTSADVTGDPGRVVGYGAAVFTKTPQIAARPQELSLTGEEQAYLLALARLSVESMVGKVELYHPAPPASAALNREAGAFVTLTRKGLLRGCVGYTSAAKPLYLAVRDTATLAAVRDMRFAPVTAEELAEIGYEISVLSPLRRVRDIDRIEIGRDGLLVKTGDREGLLLPQVAAENQWDRTRFLEQTCLKAGLPRDAWKDDGTDIFQFTALVFNDREGSARS